MYLYQAEQATVEPPSALLALVQENRGGLHLTQREQSGKDIRPKVVSGENVKKRK